VVHLLLHLLLVDDGGWDDEDDHELDQLCFCQKLSGLMMWAVWMEEAK